MSGDFIELDDHNGSITVSDESASHDGFQPTKGGNTRSMEVWSVGTAPLDTGRDRMMWFWKHILQFYFLFCHRNKLQLMIERSSLGQC